MPEPAGKPTHCYTVVSINGSFHWPQPLSLPGIIIPLSLLKMLLKKGLPLHPRLMSCMSF